MKTKQIAVGVASVIGLVLILWCYFSVRSCVEERRWLALGPIENHPRRIYDVKFTREFNDMNDVQLQMAQAVGVPPVADRAAAESLKASLVEITDTESYVVDSLTHSIPFLVPSAKEIGEHGISLGEMNAILLQKVEEMTLRMIEMEKRIQELEAQSDMNNP